MFNEVGRYGWFNFLFTINQTLNLRYLASILRRGILSLGISLYLQTKLSIKDLLGTSN